MARKYNRTDHQAQRAGDRQRSVTNTTLATLGTLGAVASPLLGGLDPMLLFGLGAIPAMFMAQASGAFSSFTALERERAKESKRRSGRPVLGMPPDRDCFNAMLEACQDKGRLMIDKYLVGFELESGKPMWIDEDDLCTHAAVFAKTGVGKTLWLESLIFQQLARGRASGCTFIDAKRDSGTLAHIILMCLMTGRIEDLIVIDPFEPVHSYNFCLTHQRSDVKARKVLRAGLPPTSDQSATKHYDRLAADSIYRTVRAMESFGLAWSIRDIAVALSAFQVAYPQMRNMLYKIGARQAMVELGHLASSYRNPKGILDSARITDNLRGIASELHSISGSDTGKIFCTTYTDLVLTDAILRGKIIYFMLPRLEEAESAARMVKVFREDLEVSIGEITSSRLHNLEDPHLVIIDEGSSTFGPTWANLFELARKGRFALLFGAQSTGGLTDQALGLSEAFYERVMANVNLKVMMRIGDNRTAMDMAEWIGKIATTKKSLGAGITLSKSNSLLKGNFDLSARSGAGESQSISISEDEADLVSAEELKHEMSAEKGLAWFDMGDGRIIKGRSFWVNSELPDTWEGREFLMRLEKLENDEVGLADWVDEEILSQERKDTSADFAPRAPREGAPHGGGYGGGGGYSGGGSSSAPPPRRTDGERREGDGSAPLADQPASSFKISLIPKGPRIRGSVSTFKAAPAPGAPAAAPPAAPPAATADKEKAQEKPPAAAPAPAAPAAHAAPAAKPAPQQAPKPKEPPVAAAPPPPPPAPPKDASKPPQQGPKDPKPLGSPRDSTPAAIMKDRTAGGGGGASKNQGNQQSQNQPQDRAQDQAQGQSQNQGQQKPPGQGGDDRQKKSKSGLKFK